MNIQNSVLAFLIATGFVGWGMLGKYSQANSGWVGTIAMTATAAIVAALSIKDLQVGTPNIKIILLIVTAGLINGVAAWLYSIKITDPLTPTAAFMASVFIFMVILAPAFDWILNGATPTANQIVGYVLAIVAIIFLNKK